MAMVRFISIFLMFILFIPTVCSANFKFKTINVAEGTGYTRTQNYVTFGVPLSRDDALYGVENLALYDEGGTLLDAQFNIVGRWDGAPDNIDKPVKWVLISCVVNSLAGNASISYMLKNDGTGGGTSGIVITDDDTKMTVNTGSAVFELSKENFNLFNRVSIDGVELVSPDNNNGGKIIDVSSGIQTPNGGSSYTENSGTYLTSDANILNFEVEKLESGKIHSIITVRGVGSNSDASNHIEWLMRLHFYKNSAAVKVSYTFTDRYLPSNLDRYEIDYVGLRTKLNATDSLVTRFAGEIETQTVFDYNLGEKSSITMLQTGVIAQDLLAYNPGSLSDLSFSIDGTRRGNRSRGWVDISDGTKGILCAVKSFWKMYPKEFIVDADGALDIALWPSSVSNMMLYGCAQRTHEILYHFYVGSKSPDELESMSRQFQFPVVPLISQEDASFSRALGVLAVFDRDRVLPEVVDLADALQTKINQVADWIISERAYDTNESGKHSYGMWATGDNHRGDSFWAANDYDLVRAYILAALSSTSEEYRYKWLSIVSDTAPHVYDVQIQHNYVHNRNDIGSDLVPIIRNGNTREKKYVGRSAYNPSSVFHDMGTNSRVNVNVHHQIGAQGLSYYYFLTGDIMAKEIAISQRFYMRTFRESWEAGDFESRTYGQFLSIWMGIYSLTGDLDDLNDLEYWYDYANTQQDGTSAYDPSGQIWTGSANSTVSFMNSLMFNALLDLEILLPQKSDEIKSRILKAADFTQNQSKHLWSDSNDWFWRDPTSEEWPGFYFSASTGFAYASAKAEDPADRDRFKTITMESYTKGLNNTPISKEKDVSSLLRGLLNGFYYFNIPMRPLNLNLISNP